jgi:hypothetical protein
MTQLLKKSLDRSPAISRTPFLVGKPEAKLVVELLQVWIGAFQDEPLGSDRTSIELCTRKNDIRDVTTQRMRRVWASLHEVESEPLVLFGNASHGKATECIFVPERHVEVPGFSAILPVQQAPVEASFAGPMPCVSPRPFPRVYRRFVERTNGEVGTEHAA